MGLASAQLLAGLFSALWLLVAARNLPRTQFGDLTLMLGLAGIFVIFSDLGLPTALGIQVAQSQMLDPRVLAAVVRRRLILSLAATLGAGLFYAVAASTFSVLVPLIFLGYFAGAAVYTTETVALRSLDRTHVEAINLVVSRLGVLALGALWLTHGGGLLAAATVYSTAALVSAAVVTVITRRHTAHAAESLPVDDLKIRRTYAFAVAAIAGTFYASVDIWILATLKGTAVSGGYAAADRVLDAILLPAAAIAVLTQSRYPRYETTRQGGFLARLVALGMASVVVPVVIGSLFAGTLMAVLFGESFRADATVLIVLLCSAPAGAAMVILSLPVILEKGHLFAIIFLAGLTVNVGLNLVLIPTWSASGAAVANLGSDIAVACALGGTMWWRRRIRQPGPAGAG